ncbi:MAG: tetratricopeptide repeat protein [Flavobacteriaceae bacterium]
MKLKFLFSYIVLLISIAEVNSKCPEVLMSDVSVAFFQSNDSVLFKQLKKADSLYLKRKHSEALFIALEVLDKSNRENKFKLKSDANYLIGKIWYRNKDYKKSISYLKKSLNGFYNLLDNVEGFSDSQQDYEISQNNLKIGTAYSKLYNLRKLEKSLREIYKDSAIFYYKQVIKSPSLKKKHSLLQSRAYNNLSGIYARDSIFDLAESYAMKALDVKRRLGDQYGISVAYSNLANIYFFKGDYLKSKESLKDGLKILEKISGEKADRYKADLYFNLAFSMYKLRDYKAYEYQELSYNLSYDINENEKAKLLEEINANKNFEIGKREGVLQEEIKLLEQKDKTWFVTVLSISILIALIGTIAYFKFRQKNLSLKVSRNELLQQQRIEKLKSDSQIRILNATIDGKESERKQIAETLHDSVSTLLSSANLHLQACRSQFNGSTPVEIEKSQKIITEASDKIRDLSHTLVSSVLLKFGLQYSLKDMADKYSNSQIEIKTEISDLRRYDQGFEIKAYNIIQEFVNNILKHSKASMAELKLYEENHKLMLSINDNGQGFNKELIPEKDGLGINQIDARIKMMKGEFNIESSKGKGTKILVELPIQERETVTYV